MRYFYETFLSQSTILTNLWGKNNFKKIKNTKKIITIKIYKLFYKK